MQTTSQELKALLPTIEHSASQSASGDHKAAVLIPLYLRSEQLVAVFTKRRHDLSRHAGEISFPGGRPERGEHSLVDTAIREANEEVGLKPELVEIVGALPPTSTFITNFAVYPYVALLSSKPDLTANPEEVEQVIKLSLDELLKGHSMRRLLRKGVPVKTDTYTAGEQMIWGATARIVSQLLKYLEPLTI